MGMSIRKHLLANLLGRSSVLLLNFVTLPFYYQVLGPAAMGLIGINAAIVTLVSLLDVGLPTALNRNMSILYSTNKNDQMASNLRSFETIFIATSGGVLLFSGLLSNLMVEYWITSVDLPHSEILMSLDLMLMAAALRFLVSIYQASLYGLHQQVAVNWLVFCSASFRFVAPLVFFLYGRQTVVVFFWFQLIAVVCEFAILFFLNWKCVGWGHFLCKPSLTVLRKSLSFSLGVTGISISAALLSQLDKIILAKLLDLSQFGYYAIAFSLSAGIVSLAYPVTNAAFPHLTASTSRNDVQRAHSNFEFFYQALVGLLLPLCIFGCIHAPHLMTLYLGDEGAGFVWPLFATLVVGSFFAGLTSLPHVALLSTGNWKPPFILNMLSVPIYAFSIFLAASVGAGTVAFAYLIFQIFYFAAISLWAENEIAEIVCGVLSKSLFDALIPLSSCILVGFLTLSLMDQGYGTIGLMGYSSAFLVWCYGSLMLSKNYRTLVMGFFKRVIANEVR
ncbi:MAG: oligosaccharide flippase family protein [Kordiimonadaceae bacterium]|nr:oligosaccharide flippase family protein [Kordiimonadaceae bacterium]